MFTQLLDILTYSALSASLIASMTIAPDTALDFTADHTQLLTQETHTTTLTVKTNTPVTSLSGTMVYDDTKLTLLSTDTADELFSVRTREIAPGEVRFEMSAHSIANTIGIHDVLRTTFLVDEPGTHSIDLQNLIVTTQDDAAVHATPNMTTTLTAHARTTPLDLNADDDYTLSDLSLFMIYALSQNTDADFNNDASITWSDFKILLRAY